MRKKLMAFSEWCWFGFVKDGGGKRIALWLFLVALMSLWCGKGEEQAMAMEVRCNALQVRACRTVGFP